MTGTAALSIGDYLFAACAYQADLDAGLVTNKKKRQLELAALLARVIANEARRRGVKEVKAGEIAVSGALSRPRVDVVEASVEDGLRLGIEIKTVNEAAGRAMWNRVGDLRSFAVNFHLKFPYAVCGGVITCPAQMPGEPNLNNLLRRTEQVLSRVNGRPDEASAPHRLEAAALVVYECGATGPRLSESVPSSGSGLRYEQFIEALILSYSARFFPKSIEPE